MDEPATVLVVEDDRALSLGLAMNLRRVGYRVLTAADGQTGMRQAFDARPDLIVLDVMLPGYNGLEILDELRRRGVQVPVLILSARGRTAQKVEGLELGADDYLTKPFELSELLARCEALLRRRRTERAQEPEMVFGAVRIDPVGRSVTRDGQPLALSAKEFDLLCLLARAPGRVFDREAILDKVWGFGFAGTARTVDNFIRALRQKVEPDPSRPRHIVTVRGVGYKLEP
jgi:DNA-binding response OmpR family regulator